MPVCVLGTTEICIGAGSPLVPSPRLARVLLGVLALRANRRLPVPLVREILWGDRPPPSAAANLRSYLTRLRRLLSDAPVGLVIESGPTGYRLRAESPDIDVLHFTELAVRGRSQLHDGDHAGAISTLARAELLWRGPVFGAEPVPEALQADVEVLQMRRQEAIEDAVEARLALGEHQELAFELPALTAQWPLRERLCSLHMLALYRSGRVVEALNVYHGLRRRLDDEIGVLPSAGLQFLYRRLLRADQDLDFAPVTADMPSSALCSCTTSGRVAGYLGECSQAGHRPA